MGVTASLLYPSAEDHDGTWGTDARKLTLTDIALNTTATLAMGTGTGALTRTVDPFTAGGQAGDVRTNYCWAVNAAGADGMDSTSGLRRFTPAGAWPFKATLNLPAPSGLGGTITASVQAAVYRVSAAGVRTLLFTSTSPSTQSTTLGGATQPELNWSSATQPQYTFDAGETYAVGFTVTSTQVVGSLGTAVNVSITFRVGGNTCSIGVPAPGVRSVADRSATDTVATTDSGTRVLARSRAATDSNPSTDNGVRALTLQRAGSDTLTTADAGSRVVNRIRAGIDSLTTADSGTRTVNTQRAGTDSLTTADAGARSLTLSRGATDSIPTTDTGQRSINLARGATDNLATGAAQTVEVEVPPALVLVDGDPALSLGGPLYTRL